MWVYEAKDYEKIIWVIDLGAIHLLGVKGSILVPPWQCTLSVPWVALLVVRLMKDCFQANPFQGTKIKYVAMQLNTFINFIRKFESHVRWLRG